MSSTANIVVTVEPTAALRDARTEMCEHKGIGHPDTLCDSAVEAAARALSRAYLDDYDAAQHFNLDKALLVGGMSEPRFGGGRVLQRMKLLISGPVTALLSESPETVVRRAVTDHFAGTLNLDATLIDVVPMLRAGALNLRSVYSSTGVSRANDTSFGVGYAPLSRLEQAVLKAAQFLKSRELRAAFPALGVDYKIMGHRIDERVRLTLAVALVDRYVADVDGYFAQKALVEAEIAKCLGGACTIQCNALDDPHARNESGLYLTVTGLSAEHGDDGEVGRGNRVNGLITPCRPMSLEAVAGKNPAAHVGKLYNVLAHQLAQRILDDAEGVTHVTVRLLSAIGSPVDEPQLAAVDVCAPNGLSAAQHQLIQERVAHGLTGLPALTRQLIDGVVQIC
ncbi:S-adenosylmethionine synthetase [Burkholderia diffusa]|uniref:S-adenosylmethionine synthetase n=1 Tax=Burkholderia diffusa TaxID=488732 RepID=A0AAW3PKG8_9BURK|nr:methionine adenosyltransferase [Burkholderia diffusa]KWF26714.1 S-adenosylmethionine synthetase [Burkholderia diffusa]KWF31694.1 S-adenosylmethionine synthetase [Burkholderia diffusa]KWF39485.1 S-adenosylmethionine synthetase [Burkholderia diffusa]KWF57297.1 S-adenosylmethionine synthetase [Burkholderia diffusa]